jgi:hypothetical protein
MDYGEFEVAVHKQIQRTNTAIESNGPERLGYVDFWRAMPASSTETVGDRSELTRRGAIFVGVAIRGCSTNTTARSLQIASRNPGCYAADPGKAHPFLLNFSRRLIQL